MTKKTLRKRTGTGPEDPRYWSGTRLPDNDTIARRGAELRGIAALEVAKSQISRLDKILNQCLQWRSAEQARTASDMIQRLATEITRRVTRLEIYLDALERPGPVMRSADLYQPTHQEVLADVPDVRYTDPSQQASYYQTFPTDERKPTTSHNETPPDPDHWQHALGTMRKKQAEERVEEAKRKKRSRETSAMSDNQKAQNDARQKQHRRQKAREIRRTGYADYPHCQGCQHLDRQSDDFCRYLEIPAGQLWIHHGYCDGRQYPRGETHNAHQADSQEMHKPQADRYAFVPFDH